MSASVPSPRECPACHRTLAYCEQCERYEDVGHDLDECPGMFRAHAPVETEFLSLGYRCHRLDCLTVARRIHGRAA